MASCGYRVFRAVETFTCDRYCINQDVCRGDVLYGISISLVVMAHELVVWFDPVWRVDVDGGYPGMTSIAEQPGAGTFSIRGQFWCCYCVIPFMGLFFIGWVLVARFMPPLDPALSAETVASLFREHSVSIRLGMLVCMLSVLFLIPFCALIAAIVAGIEGAATRVWTYTVIIASGGNIVGFTFPLMFWNVAAFRFDRSPELIVLLNDLAWLPFTGMAVPFIALLPCVAIAGFLDQSERPVFPRWFSYYTLLAMAGLLPAVLVTFFQSGWFAWNGLFGGWLPFADFFMWFVMLFIFIRRHLVERINSQSGKEGTYG